MEELDLKDLYFMVKKRLWLIIALLLISTITAGLVSEFAMTPQYSTYTTLMLGRPADFESTEGISNSDIQMNRNLISTYAEIAKSKVVLNQVSADLSFETDASKIANSMQVSLLNDTEIIKITINGSSPEQITETSTAVANAFMIKVADMMKIENVQILDAAEVPTSPDGPRTKLNIAIAGVLGIMLALFIIFILEMFDHSIKTPEDVEKHLGLPVLGMIPEHK